MTFWGPAVYLQLQNGLGAHYQIKSLHIQLISTSVGAHQLSMSVGGLCHQIRGLHQLDDGDQVHDGRNAPERGSAG